MPIIKSAKKRVRTAKKASVRNSKTKRSLRSSLKALAKSPSTKAHSSVQSEVDKALKKRVIHKNKAARLKRRAAQQAKAAGVKVSKTPAKKAPVKKLPAKKAAKK
jgi:small subunit ribosomal protein S20